MLQRVEQPPFEGVRFDNNIRISVTRIPKLSFVVVNYNYGLYLEECIRSIFDQTYENIECVVIDNASTDDSASVIGRMQAEYPRLTVIRCDNNLGQTLACRKGFHASTGAYVAFVDADDFLLPEFAETHIAAHLSMPVAVGFTSNDMLELVGDQTILAGIFDASGDRIAKHSQLLTFETNRRFTKEEDGAPLFPNVDIRRVALRFVDRHTLHWVWAPTSGNVYRRDAAALFIDADGVAGLRGAFDALLNYPINALAGSVLIQKSLSVYRIHANNMFARHALLNMVRAYDHKTDDAAPAVLAALDHMAKNMTLFHNKSADPRELWRSMSSLRRKVQKHSAFTVLVDDLTRRFASFYWTRCVRKLKKDQGRQYS
jgi:glycosyltransferase involved in cell wall biosynthesis